VISSTSLLAGSRYLRSMRSMSPGSVRSSRLRADRLTAIGTSRSPVCQLPLTDSLVEHPLGNGRISSVRSMIG